LKRKPTTLVNWEESRKLREIWDRKAKTSQAKFGKDFDLGGQAYVHQCLTGKVVLNLKAAMAFSSHLDCVISDFSQRLDDELAAIVNFDTDQKCRLFQRQKLFTRNIRESL
jgi:hypothetical protein